jgi:predicted secreted protein
MRIETTETVTRDPDVVARMAELETEVRMLRELLAEVQTNRDDWRRRAERLPTDQTPHPAPVRNHSGGPVAPMAIRSRLVAG